MVSTTFTNADWGETTVLDGDVTDQVAMLKEHDGDGELAAARLGQDHVTVLPRCDRIAD